MFGMPPPGGSMFTRTRRCGALDLNDRVVRSAVVVLTGAIMDKVMAIISLYYRRRPRRRAAQTEQNR
jgi:hypothetical protein